jgi:hypothetical protein
VIFQVITAMSMKMNVFWDVAPYSLVETDVSEVLSASINRTMNKPHARKLGKMWEQVGQGRSLAGPMGREDSGEDRQGKAAKGRGKSYTMQVDRDNNIWNENRKEQKTGEETEGKK